MGENSVIIGDAPGATITPAMQDYLKAVYRLGQDGPVATQRLADELAVAPSSATNMAKRLHELGLVMHEPYHGVTLTEAGRRGALQGVRRDPVWGDHPAPAGRVGLGGGPAEAERVR